MLIESSSEPKKNALMQLFEKRDGQPIIQPKQAKKVKTSDNKQEDALYKILSWRDSYPSYIHPQQATYLSINQTRIPLSHQSTWPTSLQGIFINIDYSITSFSQLKQLKLPQSLIHNGIVFIWGDKMNIGEMIDYFQHMGFYYVENFVFVLLDRNKIPEKKPTNNKGNTSLLNFFTLNKNTKQQSCKKQQLVQKDYQTGKVQKVHKIFCNGDSTYFKQTQKVLYMFRKVSKTQPLQLRHQRTSDVYFTIGNSLTLDWKSKEIVYKMIQTLLISANYKKGQGFKLMELWGEQGKPRKGWVNVVENQINQDCNHTDNIQNLAHNSVYNSLQQKKINQ